MSWSSTIGPVLERTINRYYDPTCDQFLSIDPEVAVTGQPYAFTNDDPLNAEDPLGDDPPIIRTTAELQEYRANADEVVAQTLLLVVRNEQNQAFQADTIITSKHCLQNWDSAYCQANVNTWSNYSPATLNDQLEEASQYAYNAYKLYKSGAAAWQSYGQYIFDNSQLPFAENVAQQTTDLENILTDGAQGQGAFASFGQDLEEACEMWC